MRILFMGTPDYAAAALSAIAEAGHEIALVVTKPDKPVGRGGKVAFSAVKQRALELGLPVWQPARIRDAEAVARLRAVNADIGVVAAFGQILSDEDLAAPRLGCVNLHASLLPRYRGSSPIQQAILDGIEVTGVTLMKMDIGIDTGDILLQEECPIAPDETAGSLFDKLAAIGASLIVRALPAIERGELTPIRQNEAFASATRRVGKEMGEIRWQQDAAFIERQIRAASPWPSAYTHLPDGRLLKIWRAEVCGGESWRKAWNRLEPGTVLEAADDAFSVRCGEGALIVRETQLEGKRRMSAHDFLLGFALREGMVLS